MPESNSAANPLPTLRHRRPTNATGCFWAFLVVVVLFGISVFTKGSMELFGFGLLMAVPLSLTLFFERWRLDSKIIRSATDWCRLHFPESGNAPIVDFIVALARKTEIDWESLKPTSPLTPFNLTQRFGEPAKLYAEHDFPRKWIEDLAKDAGIRLTDNAEFCGTTVEDAVQFIVKFEKPPMMTATS